MAKKIYKTDFQLFIHENNLKKNVIAEYLGVSNAFITQLTQGLRDIPDEKLALIKANSEWNSSMFSGGVMPITQMTTKGDKIAALNKMIAEIQLNGKKRDKIHFIPLMNIDAVGGSGNDVCDTPEYIEELIPVTGARESSICLPVSGDSMMPIFNPGDLVVIDEVVEWTLFLEMGQYYVIALKDNRRLIKKITYSEEDKMQKFLLVSENPKYPPVELPKSLIHRIFIVTQKHQKLTL